MRGGGGGAGVHIQVHAGKQDALLRLLRAVRFHQAVVFCNQRWHAQQLANALTAAGFPARFTCGALPEPQRAAAMDAMRSFRLRVLVSTDLTARGVDLQHVNLVVMIYALALSARSVHRRWGHVGQLACLLNTQSPEMR